METGKNRSVREKVRTFRKRWKTDYFYQTIAGAVLSFACTALFSLYHGYLCLAFVSAWHGSIGIFYLLLTAIRGSILLTEKGNRNRPAEIQSHHRRRTFFISTRLLLALDLSLILPISLMAVFAKPVTIGIIPAITMAAYTTYKITMACIHIRRQKRSPSDNILVTELRTVNFIDALVSILTLQNTLIMVNQTSDSRNMLQLSAASSAVIYAAIVVTTIVMLRKGAKRHCPQT